MNCLFVSSEHPYPPHTGGGPLRLYHLLRELAPRHRIVLLSCTEREIVPPWRTALEDLGIEVHICRVQNGTPTPFRDQPWMWQKYWSREVISELLRLFGSRSFDMVQFDMPPMARLVPLIQGVPRILAPNDSLTLSTRRRLSSRPIWRRAFAADVLQYAWARRYERRFFNEADSCVVVSWQEQQALQRTCPQLQTVVVPNGVDAAQFSHQGERRDPNMVLFTGTMDYPPNLDAAVWFARHVWPMVRHHHHTARFTLAGRNASKRVTALAALPGVEVVGEVPDMRPWLTRCSVYVSPLRQGGGIKNKVLEAMAASCAVVSTAMGVEGIEGVVPGEHYLSANRRSELAESVLQLLRDPGRAILLGQHARRLVSERFSWSAMAAGYEQAYVRALRGRHPAGLQSVPQ